MTTTNARSIGDLAHTAHPPWCGRGHLCQLAEHRSEPIDVRAEGLAHGMVVRVLTGRLQHAEIRLRVTLAPDELTARTQLHNLLSDLRDLAATGGYVSVTGNPPPDTTGWAA